MPLLIPQSRLLTVQSNDSDSIVAATGTSEQLFASTFTFPAGYFYAGRLVRVTLAFEYTTSAASLPNFKYRVLLVDATPTTVAMYDPTTATMGPSITLDSFGHEFLLLGRAAPSASAAIDMVNVTAWFNSNLPGKNTIGMGVNNKTTDPLTLKVGGTFSNTTAGNQVWFKTIIIEELN